MLRKRRYISLLFHSVCHPFVSNVSPVSGVMSKFYVLAVGFISCCNCHHFDSKKFALELFFIESYKLLLCFLFMNTFQKFTCLH